MLKNTRWHKSSYMYMCVRRPAFFATQNIWRQNNNHAVASAPDPYHHHNHCVCAYLPLYDFTFLIRLQCRKCLMVIELKVIRFSYRTQTQTNSYVVSIEHAQYKLLQKLLQNQDSDGMGIKNYI